MLTGTDLIRLPYTPDLTEGGIAYACRSLAYTYNRMGGDPAARLRRIVAGVAVELALRRYLGDRQVPFDVLGATPFTEPDHYDLALGGHRCDVKSYLIFRRRQIVLLRRHPSRALQVLALVPWDQHWAEGHTPGDIYLFAFLLGIIATSLRDTLRAQSSGQPAYLIHPLPLEWARPSRWRPFEGLVLKSECETPLTVELGGQNADRQFLTLTCELPPRQRLYPPSDFYSLAYVHVTEIPTARVGLHVPAYGSPYLIAPYQWRNIWVYGMEIWLLGWLTHERFQRQAEVLLPGAAVFPYTSTRTKNLAVPVQELEPLLPLLEKVRAWK